MNPSSRRKFLSDVGTGMLLAGIGAGLAEELGISPAFADEERSALDFGSFEPLVRLLEETPLEKLQPAIVAEISRGTPLKTLVAAGALANARRFAGQDYVGYHTLMALMPAWRMAEELPQKERPLPVLKVLYRNTARIHEAGGDARLHAIEPRTGDDRSAAELAALLFQEMCEVDMEGAEEAFATLVDRAPKRAFDALQPLVEDAPDVHRVTLAWRAWEVLDLVGEKHAHTLLRQSVRYGVEHERARRDRKQPEPELRSLLPRLLDAHRVLEKTSSLASFRAAETALVESLAQAIHQGTRAAAAEAVAVALAEAFPPEAIGEALSLAANALVLHDPGRPEKWASADKPRDSVHGASVGVHASDAANSWRNIARVTDARNRAASLIAGAWHTAGQKGSVSDSPFPFDVETERARKLDAERLLAELDVAVRAKEQPRAMALVRTAELAGHAPAPIFDRLRRYAITEDGALHAEKYFRTVTEEFATTRAEFRWRHLIGLARVSASEYGWPAPGREEARELLGV